jgi:GntR family transcriptional regulator
VIDERGNHPSRSPKYYAVKRHLLDLISALPVGSAIPTERVLTIELGTSRTTVRQALSEMVGEGRLVRRQGSGTFVAEPKISWPLQMTSFSEQAAVHGHVASTQLLLAERQPSEADVAARLAIRTGGPIFCIERLRLVDNAPMAVETSYLSAARFPGLATKMRTAPSLYRVLSEAYGAVPATAEETIETAAASPREAKLLDTETGSPMLVLSSHSFDALGQPIEWVRGWYRGDRYTFVAQVSAPD